MQQIIVLQPAEVNITGNGAQIPVSVKEAAVGSEITTSMPLKLELKAKTDVILNQGSEETSLDKSDSKVVVKIENNTKKGTSITTNQRAAESIGANTIVISDGSKVTENSPTTPPATPTTPPTTPSVSSVIVKTAPTKISYTEAETLDLTGLVVTLTKSDASTKNALIWRNYMSKLKSIEELERIRQAAKDKLDIRTTAELEGRVIIRVGMATCGIASGARETMQAIIDELTKQNIANVSVTQTGCMGSCAKEPVVEVISKDIPSVIYGHVDAKRGREIVTEHIMNRRLLQNAIISNSFDQ